MQRGFLKELDSNADKLKEKKKCCEICQHDAATGRCIQSMRPFHDKFQLVEDNKQEKEELETESGLSIDSIIERLSKAFK